MKQRVWGRSPRAVPSLSRTSMRAEPTAHCPSWELLVTTSLDGADGKQTNGCYGMMAPREGCAVALAAWGIHHSLRCGFVMPGTWIQTTSLPQTHSSLCTGGVCSLHLDGAGPMDGAWCCTRVPDPHSSAQVCERPALAPSRDHVLGTRFESPAQRGWLYPHHLPGT